MRRFQWKVAALALALGGAAVAQDVKGTVLYVDPTQRHVWLRDGTELKVDPHSEVWRDDAASSLKELVPGDEVRASRTEDTGDVIEIKAVSRDEKPPAAEAPKKAP